MREMLEALDPAADELRAEQLSRWESGDRVRLEALLAARPGLSDNTEAMLDLIYGEVLLREEHGDRPEREEYLRRFPQLAEALRRQFDVHEALNALEPAPGSGDTEVDSSHASRSAPLAIPGQLGQYEILEEI